MAEVGSVEQGAPSVLTGLSTGYNPSSIVAQDKSRGNNFFGFSRAHLFGKLMSYLGYGRVTDEYIKIATDFPSSTSAQQKAVMLKILPYHHFRYSLIKKSTKTFSAVPNGNLLIHLLII